MNYKKICSLFLAAAMTVASVATPALADSVVDAASSVTSWADLYRGLGVDVAEGEGLYDAVTSATAFTSYHAKDIPPVVSRVKDAEGKTTALDGVLLTGKEATQEVKLSTATYQYSSGYGIGEFDIVPDDTVEGYVWNDYFAGLYAVTISDGTNVVGTVPWIDYYGESATAGPHYNKVQIAINTGEAKAKNFAEVHRFDAMMDENGNLNPGTYTVTLYSEGYKTLVAENIEVKKVSGVDIYANGVSVGATSVQVSGVEDLPSDFDAVYSVDGNEQTLSVVDGAASAMLSLPENLAIGNHTISVQDKSGKYSDLSASFLCATDQVMAVYDANSAALVKAYGVSDEAWNAYVKAIQKVTVNGTVYSASGRGAVKIINADGKINLDLEANGAAVFTNDAVNSVVVTALGYTSDVQISVEKGNVEEPVMPEPVQEEQTMIVNASSDTIQGSAIAKASQQVTLSVEAVGEVSYMVSNYNYMSVNGNVVTFKKGTPAGSYVITVVATGNNAYKPASQTITVKVVKSTQPMKVTPATKTLKASALKRAAASFTIKTSSAAGTVTYKSSSKNVTVTSKGKVTIKKGTPKGSYKVTVTAAGNGYYNKGTKTVTIKVQ